MKMVVKDRTSEKGVFWTAYIMGILFSFISLFAAGSTKYSDDVKNSLKWLGTWAGMITGVPFLISISCFINSNIVVGTILACVFVMLVVLVIIFRKVFYQIAES